MERRKFILTSAVAAIAAIFPIFAFGKQPNLKSEKRAKGFLVKANESRFGEKTMMGISPNDIKISAKDNDGNLSMFEYMGNNKGGQPLHIHYKMDETFYIIDGDYIFHIGDEKFQAKSGDTVFIPRATPHTFAQTSEKGKVIYMFQPAGRMEELFRKTNDPNKKLTSEEMTKLSTECDSKALGPPLQF